MDCELRNYLVENDLLSMLYGLIEKDTNGVMCFIRSDKSGRDYYDLIPLDYINEDEKQRIVDYITDYYEDSIGDYDEDEEEPYELNVCELEDWIDDIVDLIKELSKEVK